MIQQKGVQEELGTARINVMPLRYTSLHWVKEELGCTGGMRGCVPGHHSVTILTGLSCANMEDFPGSYSNMLLGSALYFLVSTFLSGGPHWFLGDNMDHNVKTKLVWPTDILRKILWQIGVCYRQVCKCAKRHMDRQIRHTDRQVGIYTETHTHRQVGIEIQIDIQTDR